MLCPCSAALRCGCTEGRCPLSPQELWQRGRSLRQMALSSQLLGASATSWEAVSVPTHRGSSPRLL